VPLAEIAARVGTPVYFHSTATISRHAAVFRRALEPFLCPLIRLAAASLSAPKSNRASTEL
jgi:diaminopimelate decarboxylase